MSSRFRPKSSAVVVLGLGLAISLGVNLSGYFSERVISARLGLCAERAERAETLVATQRRERAAQLASWANTLSRAPSPRNKGSAPASPFLRAPAAADLANERDDQGTKAKRAKNTSPSTGEHSQAHQDWQLRRDVLCEVGRVHLERHWQSEKEDILAGVKKAVSDEERIAADEKRELSRLAEELGLNVAERQSVAGPYVELRRRRVAAVREALSLDDPDLSLVLDQVRGLYADEDQLIEAQFGSERLARYRKAEAEPRTSILAVLATLAGRDWAYATRW